VSLDAHRLRARCPEEFLPLLRDLAAPRMEIEAFHRRAPGEADIIGTTWLHPAYTIGSVNMGDLRAHRRPLVAYWMRNGAPAALRLRCLRNGTDFPSAGLFSVQDRGDVLGAVIFATDREDAPDAPGPRDPVKDGPILAEDLRVRFEIEGAADIPMPPNLRPSGAARLALGPAACDIQVIHASLGGPAAPLEAGSDGRSSWIDAVLYHGALRDLIVPSRSRAAVIFALSLRAPAEGIPAGMDSRASFTGSTATVIWRRGGGTALLLSVPVRPLPEAAQRRSAAALRGGGDPWKA